jgi:hypothetical protein
MASQHLYWTSDGGGADGGSRAAAMHQWILSQNNAALIVFGGDVYNKGKPSEFGQFLAQMNQDVSGMCHTPGNHDWMTIEQNSGTGEIPSGYEEFWASHSSRQPINTLKKSGARYEHTVDLAGWRLLFLDTGLCKEEPWPMGDQSRMEWLQQQLGIPGRAKIIFAHHSRLSCGLHGNNEGVDDLWQSLFTSDGVPLAALTISGHDHNVNIYSARGRNNPEATKVPFADGIPLIVNGAGGSGFYTAFNGEEGDMFSAFTEYCITHIELIDEKNASVKTLSFGANPAAVQTPTTVSEFQLNV